MNIKNIIRNLHLILGLISGIIVFIVAVTGCLYAFKGEIESITQTYKHVKPQNAEFILPSEAKVTAQKIFPDRHMHGVAYEGHGKAIEVVFYEAKPSFYYGIFMNPYNGEIIKIKNYNRDFFRIVLQGHFNLWLPMKVGKPIIATSVLIFVVMLITGIVLWWPKKNSKYKGFFIKRNSNGKFKLLDLHSVFGFYANLILLVVALTGLVWGFDWFSEGVYKATGGKKDLSFDISGSDSTLIDSLPYTDASVNKLWHQLKNEYPEGSEIEIHFPHEDDNEALFIHVNSDDKTYWKTDFRYFDRYTLEEIKVENIWGRFEDTNKGADKLRRLNYDIHVGSILGFPGKILVFLASFICASLPITGFLMWRNKQKEKAKLKLAMDL